MARIEFENLFVMAAGEKRLVKLLRVDIGEHEMGANFIGSINQQFTQFIGGVDRVIGIPKREGKIVAGVGGGGFELDGLFIGAESEREIFEKVGNDPEIIVGLEERRIFRDGLAVKVDGGAEPFFLLHQSALLKEAFGFGGLAFGELVVFLVGITREAGGRLRGGGRGDLRIFRRSGENGSWCGASRRSFR